ncbi:T9SS type A sorting domain-containing protein [Flavobacterium sp. CYK-55]|uniref:T9SS type A sorting domain-containing protein n=1 Tax=Flavobacterium sp. CYK-55 TaxID=2835529 RepID=UPI001BCE4A90|nr:T9SS type A sorting domain-containing protein [Flavobacterium sp. CYK-55]MBS7786732.1 T9SS type A sorting domain-containing protein [Flavobacterium sp. CYK-55]
MKKTTFNLMLGFALLFPILIFGQANDNFADAEAISCGGNYTGSTATATLDEDSAPDGFGADMDAPNVWYSYTGTGSAETITLNLCNSAYDSSVLVYTGSSGSLTLIAGNDDDNTCGAALTTRSRLSFNSDGLTTYYIAIEGWNATSTGTYTMDVTCTAVNPPAVNNQNCDTALTLNVDGSSTDSDNSYGDVSPNQPTCDTFGNIQDVWFSFTAPSATVDCVVTPNGMTSGNMAIYSGDCLGGLTQMSCLSNFTVAATQSMTTLTAGETYYVQVWSNGAEQGTFSIALTDPSICMPVATFEKISNCPVDATFTVTADVSSLASATSVTVTDNQGSAPQTISSPSMLTFGPYPGGTSVVLTVTNDQSTACFLESATFTQGVSCPMANDDCANAVTLVCGDTLTAQTTEGASGGTGTSCVGTIGDDVWYTFVGDGQIFSLTATATGTESPQLEVYESTDGSCSGFTPGNCYAAGGSGETAVTLLFNTTNGTVYYAHVGNWINGDPAVDFDLALTCSAPPTPPANDDCSGAYVVTVNPDLSCASVTSGTVMGATASAVDDTSCGGAEDDDVWFSFVATDTRHQISLNNVTGSTTDMYHSLWEGDCASLTLVAGSCSDANTSNPTGLTVGNTYYIRVNTFGTVALADTTFDVCVGTLPPPPANDDCTAAEPLTVGTAFADFAIVSSNASASSTTGLTFNCQTNRKNDVWYSFTVPASGSFTVETDTNAGTAMTDSVISVFSGTCGALTEVGCDDDTGNGNFSKVSVTGQNPGDTLYIGVWSWGTSADGEFQLSVYDPTAATSSFDNANFTYYPNPVDTVLNLNYVKNISSVSVYNLVGQQVMTKTSNNLTQVDMSHLASGTYLVKVTSDNQVKTIKINKL